MSPAWVLPSGKKLVGRKIGEYVGLKGQPRIVIVDTQGRVHHHDEQELQPSEDLGRGQ